MSKNHIIKLDEYWPYQVTVLADLIARHTNSVLRAHSDLNLSQWRVLAAVAEKQGRTAAEVVTVTPMDKGIVSRATASLVERGILDKVNDNDDKRRSHLYLTARGQNLYKNVSQDLTQKTDTISIPKKLSAKLKTSIESMSALSDI